MNRCIFLLCALAVMAATAAQDPIPPIGFWREHLPYKSAIDLAAADGKIFCATPYSLFSVEPASGMQQRYSRVSGLSETGISAIRYDETGKKLFIAYSNSNIDILYRNDIFNIPDLKRDNITGDKTIYNIYPKGQLFYLSTGLGVVVIDAIKYEIRDSWMIGNGGAQVKVSGFTSDENFFYAATTEGLKKISLASPNPADFSNWTLVSGSQGLQPGACQNVMTVASKVIVQKGDSLFVQNGNQWMLLYSDGWPLISSDISGTSILLCQRQTGGASRVLVLNPDGSVSRSIQNTAAISFPRKAITVNGMLWVADQYNCLIAFDSGTGQTRTVLNSPQEISSGEMKVYKGVFYATAGAVNNAWNYQYNGDGIFMFAEGEWTNINRYRYPAIDSLLDYITVAIDRRDESIWAGSFGGGLLHIKPGIQFEIFKQNYLGAAAGDPGSYRVSGLAFDDQDQLWISNFGAAQPLRVIKSDGQWKAFTIPFFITENALSQIVPDQNGYKWIVAPKGNGILCFDHGASVDDLSDDRWRRFLAGSGNGNLPAQEATCIAIDKSGYIWVGSTDGIGVIQCPDQAFSAQGCDAVWPVVPNGNFAGYLFKGQEVRDIAVDGANRKWIAAKKGAFLVSPTGEKVLYRFTEDNSPLMSSDVRKIAIDGKTGEVFFATAKGICSFRSTATEAGSSNEEVLVFPNPVPPGYSGTIAIRGLVNNAIVKITELDGRLLYQTRALGGQAVWDGRNYRGQKISSGAYLVLVSDDDNHSTGKRERVATKIFFISR